MASSSATPVISLEACQVPETNEIISPFHTQDSSKSQLTYVLRSYPFSFMISLLTVTRHAKMR